MAFIEFAFTLTDTMKINYLDVAENLGLLDGHWTDWKLRAGQLFDPFHSSSIGYRPEELRALPFHMQRIAALEAQLRATRAPANNPVTRAADLNPPTFERRAIERRRGTAPVLVRLDPAPVRAEPAQHKRSLK